MNDKVFDQIMAIRVMPNCPNMFDTAAVQRIAFDNEFYELTIFIEEHKREYCEFILHGTR